MNNTVAVTDCFFEAKDAYTRAVNSTVDRTPNTNDGMRNAVSLMGILSVSSIDTCPRKMA